MRTYQVTKHEGERMGDIDWGYDFRCRLQCRGGSPEYLADFLFQQIFNLWRVERLFKAGAELRVTEGQYDHDLLDVGMYDGWPYWKPVPSVCVRTVLGFEWRQFPCVDYFKVLKPAPSPTVVVNLDAARERL